MTEIGKQRKYYTFLEHPIHELYIGGEYELRVVHTTTTDSTVITSSN